MQIRNKNLKDGVITVQTQSLDDVWTIYRIVELGDLIGGDTERKIKIGDASTEKGGNVSIRRMYLTISVEKNAYENDGRSVRFLGPITQGNDYVAAGDHHSFTIDEKSTITITKKKWPTYALRAMEEATHASKGSALIVAFDRQVATIGTLSSRGFSKLATLEGSVQKKGSDAPAKSTFNEDIVKQLISLNERIKPTAIILASSNFWKDALLQQIDTQAKDLRKKTKWIECDDTSERALGELVNAKEFQQQILAQSQTNIYTIFDEILRRIATSGPATYGISNITSATNQAAIHTLIISSELMHKARQKNEFEKIETLLANAESSGAIVHIVGDEYTIYDKLNGLGGIVALLRFAIE